jgi:L-aminopeptidase/D-esterase-like protein
MTEDRNRSVSFDFPELRVGIAEYDDGPTGCTVLHLPEGADCALDIRGGAPGVFGGNFGFAHAICFAGGSLYGLEAATGVAAELLRQRGSVNWTTIDLVSGAIIWDWTGRDNLVYPDKELGRQALLAAETSSCPVGARGAGRSATVGKFGRELTPPLTSEPSGQGAAFVEIGQTGAKLFMLTVVNAVGVIINREGNVVRGAVDPATGRRVDPRSVANRLVRADDRSAREGLPTQNTTINALVTNVKLSPIELDRLGKQVHTSMARAIRPFHAMNDGDVFFALSTGTVEPAISNFALTEIACDLAWDAVLNAVGA